MAAVLSLITLEPSTDMAIDTSIIGRLQPAQIESPVNALAKMMQVQNLQQGGQLNALALEEKRQGIEDQNFLRSALSAPGADPYKVLLQRGKVKEAGDYRNSQLETDKKSFDLNKERFGVVRRAAASFANDPTISRDKVLSALQAYSVGGVVPEHLASSFAKELPEDPAQLKAMLLNFAKQDLSSEQLFTLFAPKATQIDSGQQISFRDTNPNSPTYGQVTGGAPVQKLQSPDSVASTVTARRGQDMVDRRAKTANDLKALEVSNERGSGLPVLGVPVPTVTPWANQSNSKDANKVRAAEAARGSKEIEKDVDGARAAAAVAADAKRFIDLNGKINTGGITDKVGAGRWLQSFGPEYAELEAITAKLVPAMRQPGSGTTSDRDLSMFERATVGVDKPAKTNKNIALAIIARSEQAQEYADFRQTYLEQNGTLQGADRYWKDYVNKNPIFDPKKEGAFELNKGRKSWAEHFKGQDKAGQPAAAEAPAAPAVPAAGLPKGWTVKAQ